MTEKIRIAIDAMGGDNAPAAIVAGGIQAAKSLDNVQIILVGKEEEIKKCSSSFPENIEIVDAPEDIAMDEKNPARAVRKAKNSSIYVANQMVAEGKADAVIAAGHTGAATAASLFILKRIDGFERPCICTYIPTTENNMFLIDGGSNIETSPEQMRQSGLIGKVLAKIMMDKENPKIGLLNVGEEEGKGTDRYKEAWTLMNEDPNLNFIGNVEGKTIIDDLCDVAVVDGFTGNIHLKALEGGLKMMSSAIQIQAKKNPLALIGALLMKLAGTFDTIKAHFHPNSYGGALLGGVNGVSIISHGSSNAEAIKNASKQAKLLVEKGVIQAVKEAI